MNGLITALITPFLESEEVDYEGLKIILKRQVEACVDGVLVLGTTGEAPTLTEREREEVIRTAKEVLGEKCPLMVGTGSNSTIQTIRATERAKELGADSVLIVTPYYNKPTQKGIAKHFTMVAETVDIPIVVYNIEGRTGKNIETETLKEIAAHPNIVGVKEASGHLLQVSDVLEKIGPDFSVMSGDDALTLPILSYGGHGVISVVSNFIPEVMKQFVDILLTGDFKRGREMHFKLTPLFRAAFVETNPIPIKALMRLSGMPAGPCRMPLDEPSEQNIAFLKTVVDKYLDFLKSPVHG